MSRRRTPVFAPWLLAVAAWGGFAVAASEERPVDLLRDDVLARALRDELERAIHGLALPELPRPYHVAYTVTDYEQLAYTASFGVIESELDDRGRFLRVDLRVGSPELDNTNLFGTLRIFDHPTQLPIENDYDALRHRIWLATDEAYKKAVEDLEKKRAAGVTQIHGAGDFADFSAASAAVITDGRPPSAAPSRERLRRLVRRLSQVYREYPEIQSGRATIAVIRGRRLFVSSAGGVVLEPYTTIRLDAVARTQADDGMELERLVTFTSTLDRELPNEEEVLVAAVQASARELVALRAAPVVDDYAGPVLFEAPAAAQLARALVADHFSGTPGPRGGDPRLVQSMDGLDSELAGRLGTRVFPSGFDVVDDPTRAVLGDEPLIGRYAADAEGVPAEPVHLVRDGILRELLMSRAPRPGLTRSNGHGRAGLTGPIRGRPANLVVSAARGLSKPELRRRLGAEVRAAGLTYGIIVCALDEPTLASEADESSWTHFGGGLPLPVSLVRVGLDGKEQLLRGGVLGALQLRTLKSIVAAGDTPAVASYFAASTTGVQAPPLGGPRAPLWGIPTSVAAPALLFPDIDVERIKSPQRRPPALPRPHARDG